MVDVEEIMMVVSTSKKYRAICPDTVRRLASREASVHSSTRAAIKATKRRLHQVYGAFEHRLDYGAAYSQLDVAYGTGSRDKVRDVCRRILDAHSSTRERLPILDTFYATILEVTGQPDAVLDLGCGLNPLTLPWMGLASGARYTAVDIDADRVRFLNRYLELAGFEPQARCQDLLTHPPEDDADLALLLKMAPSLERQEPGATARLLDRLNATSIVVSFATKSLGGRDKGMPAHYERHFLELARNRNWRVQRLRFETELAFVVQR